MTDNKWTPGPWEYRGAAVIVPDWPFNMSAFAGSEANARLMASAPDLYDALNAIVEAMADLDDESAAQIAKGAGRLAVRKARGEGAPATSGVPSGSREPTNGNGE